MPPDLACFADAQKTQATVADTYQPAQERISFDVSSQHIGPSTAEGKAPPADAS